MWRDILLRLRSLLQRVAVERELDEELRFHLEHEIARNKLRGLSPAEAERKAKLDLGGFEQIKEQSRDARGVSLLETIAGDLRHGSRVLRNSPVFTAIAVISLALGVGANTAIFELVNAVRLRTLPVKDPQQLVEVLIPDTRDARGARQRDNALTYPLWEQVQKRQHTLSDVFAWANAEFNLSPQGQVRSAPGLWVSGGFFNALGLRPAAGRLFTPADDQRGCGIPGAVISYSFWKSEFGGSDTLTPSKLTINGQSVDVVGVTPPGFFGLEVGRAFQIALPICSIAQIGSFNALDAGTFWWLSVMGRLKPGTTLSQASAQLASLAPGIFARTLPPNYPPVSVPGYLHMKFKARSAAIGFSDLRERYSDLLWLLLAIAAAVLLNACVNLANLMLARAGTRDKEIAVRLALGGSPGRILQQLLIESALIAALGAAGAICLAHWLSRGLLALLTSKQAGIYLDLHADWHVLSFTLAVAAATCLIFGFTPALRAAQSKPAEALKSGGRSSTAGRSTLSLRRSLIVSQVALSLVLLAGSLLFIQSLRNLVRVEPGFRTDALAVADLGFARPNPQQIKVLPWQKALLERVARIPGVTSVADTNVVPLSGNSWSNRVWMEARDSHSGLECKWNRISPGYFRTLAIPLLSGRDFNDHDAPGAPQVALVNQAFAKQIAHSANPVGLTFHVEATPSTPETVYQVIGTVADAKYQNIREKMQPLFYLPFSQDAAPSLSDQLLIRTRLPLATLLPLLRPALLDVDPNLHFQLYDFADLLRDSLAGERLMATLSSVFAGVAALLSAVGLYGVITYIVTRRKSEIGIRIALGADRSHIVGMLFRESGKMLLAGLAAGTFLTLAIGSFVSKMLFGLESYDPPVLAAAFAVLGLVGLLAASVPALRAANIDPAGALRQE